MRIIEVLFSFPPQVFIARHILAMREKGIRPVLVALDGEAGDSHKLASILEENWDLGQVCIPAPNNKRVEKITGLRYLLKPHTRIDGSIRNKILAACLESLKPDLIHFHWGNLAGYLYSIPQSLGIPYTISLRGTDAQVFPFESEEKRLSVKRAIEGAAGVHTVSDEIWESSQKTFELLPDQVHQKTIYTTVPTDHSLSIRDGNKKKVFVSVARFQWRKSLTSLLIAFAKFNALHPDSELILIGEGELRACLEYWIRYLHLEKSVLLVGKKNYTEITQIIQNADAYVQSSIAEGLSNSVAEAMVLGCPVFATNVGGTNEVIEDSVTGFLLDPASPESWADKFGQVYNASLMQSVREKAYRSACARFSADHHAAEFGKFYQDAIDKSSEAH